MNWNNHFYLNGKHAFLSASRYHWLNYDEARMIESYNNHKAAQRGTQLHAFAESAIGLGVRLPNTKNTLNMYVNDCIRFRMETEKLLYYSDNVFGTVDAISFNGKVLKIFDLKTGVSQTSMKQLYIYAALFLMEYHINVEDVEIELRIYQLSDITIESTKEIPELKNNILQTIDRIIESDQLVEKLKEEV